MGALALALAPSAGAEPAAATAVPPAPAAAPSRPRPPRGAAAIRAALDAALGDEAAALSTKAGVRWPPSAVTLRIFKRDREAEVWAGNGGREPLRLVRTFPICAVDDEPGPKLRQGDGKTPEGFYRGDFGYDSANFWMWIDLEHPENAGRVGEDSAFKICTDYPNAADRARARLAGSRSPGSAICVHGNCVTAGCPSFTNEDFLRVFAFANHHEQRRHGPLQVHVFPFRFDRAADLAAEAATYARGTALGADRLARAWENLRDGFERFNRDPRPLRYTPSAGAIRVPGGGREPGYEYGTR